MANYVYRMFAKLDSEHETNMNLRVVCTPYLNGLVYLDLKLEW